MSVFHGNWNEDPGAFLNSYLQCTAAGGDGFKARQFINYLGVDSDAEDWFDELPQEEKKDWSAIKISFRKRWLKEVISISKTVTVENKLQPEPTVPRFTSPDRATTSPSKVNPVYAVTQTNTTVSRHLEIGSPICVALPQPTAPPGNRNNGKMDSTSENSSNITDFPSPTPLLLRRTPE